MKIKETKKQFKNDKKALKRDYRQKKKYAKGEYKSALRITQNQFESSLNQAYYAVGKAPPKNPPRRSVLEEIGNATTHGVGSIFSIVAFVLMLLYSESSIERLGAAIYFFGMITAFTMSCLYHSFKYGGVTKRLFRRFDYSSIYLLIASTFAPILLCFRGGVFGITFFVIQWVIVATGISLIGVFGPSRLRFIHIPLYILLGWSGLMLMPHMINESIGFAFWILGGGVAYSVGIIPFALKTRASHFIWHFFVLAGAALQWVGIFKYVYLI